MTSIGCKQQASTTPPNEPENAFMYGGIDFAGFSVCSAMGNGRVCVGEQNCLRVDPFHFTASLRHVKGRAVWGLKQRNVGGSRGRTARNSAGKMEF